MGKWVQFVLLVMVVFLLLLLHAIDMGEGISTKVTKALFWANPLQRRFLSVYLIETITNKTFQKFLKKQILATKVFKGFQRMHPSDRTMFVTKSSPMSTIQH